MSTNDRNNEAAPLGTRVFALDVRSEKAVGLFRLAAAGVVFAGAIAMLASSPSALGYLVAASFLLLSLAMARGFQKSRARVRAADRHFLKLTENSLQFSEDKRQIEIPWAQIDEIHVDQDALEIVVLRSDGNTLRLEPRYPGIGIDELGALMESYRTRRTPGATIR